MNELRCYRKNTFTILLDVCDYEFNDGDEVYFTVKIKPDNDSDDSDALIKTKWTYGTDCALNAAGQLELILTASQTDIAFGDYFYDLKLVSSSQNPTPEETLVTGTFSCLDVATLRV